MNWLDSPENDRVLDGQTDARSAPTTASDELLPRARRISTTDPEAADHR
jgi:hypothetical protein